MLEIIKTVFRVRDIAIIKPALGRSMRRFVLGIIAVESTFHVRKRFRKDRETGELGKGEGVKGNQSQLDSYSSPLPSPPNGAAIVRKL